MVDLVRWSKIYLALNGAIIVALLATRHNAYLIEASFLLAAGAVLTARFGLWHGILLQRFRREEQTA
jgi:hypothetical protein